MPRHFKIDDELSESHRNELLLLAVRPATKVDDVHAWLRSHGYYIGRTAAWNWVRNLRELGADPLEQIVRLLRNHGRRFNAKSLDRIRRAVAAEIAGSQI